MKTYTLKATDDNILNNFPSLCRRLEGVEGERWISLGADLERGGACFSAQVGRQAALSLGLLSRGQGVALVAALRERGFRVAVVLEACGFGWRWQGELRGAGAEVVTLAPEALCGKRKTNRRDAAALARLAWERLFEGNSAAGRVVREPSRSEQERRALCRHRAQLVGLRGKMEAQGRGVMLDFGLAEFPDCWWGKKMWPQLKALLEAGGEAWLLEVLGKLRELAMGLHQRILQLDEQLAALGREVLRGALPAGLGTATGTMVELEVMDWHRFSNRKQAGSFLGCSPSEQSTGSGQRLGQIDRMGNRRLRSALTEAVWRLKRWEPGWRGFAKWGPVIFDKQAGAVRKKKAIIACVRLLFIDLWRLNTGRATLAGLGFKTPPATPMEPAATAQP